MRLRLERGQRTYPLSLEELNTDDSTTLMSKGHNAGMNCSVAF
jgi:hypothetical protein